MLLTVVPLDGVGGGVEQGIFNRQKQALYTSKQSSRLFVSSACNIVMRTHKIFLYTVLGELYLSNIALNYRSNSRAVDMCRDSKGEVLTHGVQSWCWLDFFLLIYFFKKMLVNIIILILFTGISKLLNI
jgi:hypothetical protein